MQSSNAIAFSDLPSRGIGGDDLYVVLGSSGSISAARLKLAVWPRIIPKRTRASPNAEWAGA